MTIAEKPLLIYLHFSDNSPGEEATLELANGDKASVIWKDVLVEGEYPLTPGATGPIKRKLTVVAEGESSREENRVAMSDLVEAHNDGAFKYVTVPLKHRDEPMDNTGYVPRPRGVRVVEKSIDGESRKVLQAALGFTEPDVKGKVQRGTIPDCSAGIFFDWLNKHKNKRYRAAMKHVSLTPTPFLGNLDPFPAVFANDPDIDQEVQIQHFMFDDGTGDSGSTDDSSSKGEIVWNERASMGFIRNAIDIQLNPKQTEQDEGLPVQPRAAYYTRDVSTEDTALVEQFFKGEQTKYVIPFSREGDDIVVAPATRWVEVREAMIAAADEFVSAAEIMTKLTVLLSDMFGPEADRFAVGDVSLDQRVHICNRDTKAEYLASFVVLSDESIAVDSADNWERIKEPQPPVQPVVPVAVNDQPDLSTPQGRVQAARQQRKQHISRRR